jgi:hypothetical protein
LKLSLQNAGQKAPQKKFRVQIAAVTPHRKMDTALTVRFIVFVD